MRQLQDLNPMEKLEEVRESRKQRMQEREHLTRDLAAERHQRFLWFQELVWLVVGTLLTLIGLRLLLEFIGANPDNLFARFLYDISGVFVAPFLGITESPSFGGIVLEVPAFVSLLIYALAGILLDRIGWLLIVRPRARTIVTYKKDRG